jgi:hypothetical protein
MATALNVMHESGQPLFGPYMRSSESEVFFETSAWSMHPLNSAPRRQMWQSQSYIFSHLCSHSQSCLHET